MTARRRTCVLRRADIAVTVAAVLAYFPRAFGFVAVPAARCDVRAVRPIRTCYAVPGAAPRVQASARHGKVVLRYSEAPDSGGDKAEDPDAAADADERLEDGGVPVGVACKAVVLRHVAVPVELLPVAAAAVVAAEGDGQAEPPLDL